MYPIAVGEYSLDEELLVASHLIGEELDPTLHGLFLLNIEKRELGPDITLIFIILRKEMDKIRGRLDPRFVEPLDI